MEKYNEYLSSFLGMMDDMIENRKEDFGFGNNSNILIETNDINKALELCKQYGVNNNIKNVILDFEDIYYYNLFTSNDTDICLLSDYNGKTRERLQINENKVNNYINKEALVLYQKNGELSINDYGKKLLNSEDCILFITGLENRENNSDESFKRRQILDFMRLNRFEHLLMCVCVISSKIDDHMYLATYDGKDQFLSNLIFVF